MKKILFTGSAGKVGRLIIPFLIGNGYEIEYYDKLEGKDIFNSKELEKIKKLLCGNSFSCNSTSRFKSF